jgi:hypothetical protein
LKHQEAWACMYCLCVCIVTVCVPPHTLAPAGVGCPAAWVATCPAAWVAGLVAPTQCSWGRSSHCPPPSGQAVGEWVPLSSSSSRVLSVSAVAAQLMTGRCRTSQVTVGVGRMSRLTSTSRLRRGSSEVIGAASSNPWSPCRSCGHCCCRQRVCQAAALVHTCQPTQSD